jgi:hypothetical protein
MSRECTVVAPNNSLMLTRLAGESAMMLGQHSAHTMKGKGLSRRAA